ncbi:MAG: hypothetical protein IJG63_08055 [Oscillospiraceae bacterium]|nr:hypothetical protein [Oscillospiraceae bacterium]
MAENNDNNLIVQDESEFTLESILAEYKGSAFMTGDKKTPREELDKQAERIIQEVLNPGYVPEEEVPENVVFEELTFDETPPEVSPAAQTAPVATPPADDAPVEAAHTADTPEETAPADDRVDAPVPAETSPEQEQAVPAAAEETPRAAKPPKKRWGRRRSKAREKAAGNMREEQRREREPIREDAEPPVTVPEDIPEVADVGAPVQAEPQTEAAFAAPEPETVDAQPISAAELDEQEPAAETVQETENPQESPYEPSSVTISFEEGEEGADPADDFEIDPSVFEIGAEEFRGDEYDQAQGAEYSDEIDPDEYGDETKKRLISGSELKNEFTDLMKGFGIMLKNAAVKSGAFIKSKMQEYEYDEEPLLVEPDLLLQSKKYSARIRSLNYRTLAALVISAILFLFTILAAGPKGLFGTTDPASICCILLLLELFVLIMGIDVLLDGLADFMANKPGAETLVLASCVMSVINGFIMVLTGHCTGTPFCAVSAFALAFAMMGKIQYYTGMRDAIRAAVTVKEYHTLTTERFSEGKVLVRRASGRIDGFFRSLTMSDPQEEAWEKISPVMLVASLIFAILASIGRRRSIDFSYFLSAMLAASAAFGALTCCSWPFLTVASKLKKRGGIIAGWGGACKIAEADGVLLMDKDVFPPETISLKSIKVFEGYPQTKAIAYTGSMIMASGSGLASVFSKTMTSQNILPVLVRDFVCFEGGGIGGTIHGEDVKVGSIGFMKLLGIRVPDNVTVNPKRSLFTVINNSLVSVCNLEYAPDDRVHSGLMFMNRSGSELYLAARDFNVTPQLLQQKHRVPVGSVNALSVQDSFNISTDDKVEGDAAAVMLGSSMKANASVIYRARALYLVSKLSTILTVGGALLGLILMFYTCWNGIIVSALPVKLLIYMLICWASTFVLSYLLKRA